jgi:hypothetical protein
MQPTASIPFGHMADLELGLDVWSQGELIIRWQNFQIKFTIPADQLVKLTTHWGIWAMTRITTDPIGMQPTASIPFGHMADLELGLDVWSQAVVLGELGTSILIHMDNTRVSFMDDLIKTCSWNILYVISYTLMSC